MDACVEISELVKYNKKLLIIIRGIPGSGKSTLAENIIFYNKTRHNDISHYEADQYYYEKYNEYKWSTEENKNAHKYCHMNTELKMLLERTVVVSNTFIKKWEIDSYIELCKKYGYNWIVYRMTKEFKSVHNVPKETIDRMKNTIEDVVGEILV